MQWRQTELRSSGLIRGFTLKSVWLDQKHVVQQVARLASGLKWITALILVELFQQENIMVQAPLYIVVRKELGKKELRLLVEGTKFHFILLMNINSIQFRFPLVQIDELIDYN